MTSDKNLAAVVSTPQGDYRVVVGRGIIDDIGAEMAAALDRIEHLLGRKRVEGSDLATQVAGHWDISHRLSLHRALL